MADLAERHLGESGFRLATGTNAYFAELNRQRHRDELMLVIPSIRKSIPSMI